MWTSIFCPNFTIFSFTLLNVLVQILVWIATLIYTCEATDEGLNDYWFLGNSKETLVTFGMRMPYDIKYKGSGWRVLASLYINHGFS